VRSDGTFIGIEVAEEVAADSDVAAKLAEVCPVDIYAQNGDGRVDIVEQNIDECVLCRLCIEAAPDGTVRVLRLYDDGAPI
jgi:NAD-dependent dihydropyrimidine dehydrogenase PreA subunit